MHLPRSRTLGLHVQEQERPCDALLRREVDAVRGLSFTIWLWCLLMKAISLRQPWANFIRDGRKTIETRRWKTKYRGPLLIVSAKTVDHEAMKQWNVRPGGELPLGAIVAAINLKDIHEMTQDDEQAAMCSVYPRANAWEFDLIYPFKKSVPAKGALSIFELDCPHPAWIDHLMSNVQTGECCSSFCIICGQTKAF